MQLAELDAVTVDAYGTLVGLADPVPALREGLAALGVERGAEAVARAFAKEAAYYREHSFEGRDDESLYDLRCRCVAIILDELRSELAPEAFVDGFVAAMRFELLCVRPGRALHIGDSASDERGARAAGMHFAPAPLTQAVEALA